MKRGHPGETPKKRLWPALVVAAVVAALVAVFVMAAYERSAFGQFGAPGASPVARIGASGLTLVASIAPVAALAPGVARRAPDSIPVPVCGVGTVTMDPLSMQPADELAFDQATHWRQARDAVLERMRVSADARSRAIALIALIAEASDTATAQLARDASVGTDPAVYALALAACDAPRPDPPPPNCQGLSAARWAQLDPDNGAAWLRRLQDAAVAHEADATEAVLHRLATAGRFESASSGSLTRLFDAFGSDDRSLLALWTTTTQVLARLYSVAPPYQVIGQQCSLSAVRDANRLQLCDAILERLVERNDTLLGRAVGIRYAARIGWPSGRIDRLLGETEVYKAHVGDTWNAWARDSSRAYACDSLRGEVARLRVQATHGEAGAMRFWLAGSAPPADALIERGRQVRLRWEAPGKAPAASTTPER